jgi:hypothetical protein
MAKNILTELPNRLGDLRYSCAFDSVSFLSKQRDERPPDRQIANGCRTVALITRLSGHLSRLCPCDRRNEFCECTTIKNEISDGDRPYTRFVRVLRLCDVRYRRGAPLRRLQMPRSYRRFLTYRSLVDHGPACPHLKPKTAGRAATLRSGSENSWGAIRGLYSVVESRASLICVRGWS